jgi:hypothetical protein
MSSDGINILGKDYLTESQEELRAYDQWCGKVAPKLYTQAKKNAKRRGIAFDITQQHVNALMWRSNGRCELSGIEFDLEHRENQFRRPWAPSLDRADSSLGYSLTNCRIVCCAVNNAMSEWGEKVLWSIVAAMK